MRSLLKRRIPGLGDEIATTSAAEGRVRDVLTELLKEKGIVAHVQSDEPSYSAVASSPTELFGMPLPPMSAPTIGFSILTPKILIGKIAVRANGEDISRVVRAEVKEDEGRLYGTGSQAFWRSRVERILSQNGYLTAKASFEHTPPHVEGDCFVVDLSLIVDAGRQYHIAAITADGGPLLSDRDLSQFFSAKVGDVCGPSPFWNLGPGLRAYYNRFGYADAQIEEEPILDHDHALATYHLSVKPGPLYHLRSLTIEKLTQDQEAKVRKLLAMQPGDVFKDDAINSLYRAIAEEPLLKGYSFGFAPKRDKPAGAVDLTLQFFKEGGSSSVTIK